MDWINNLLNSFQTDALVALIGGLALGLFAKWALRVLACAVIAYIALLFVPAEYAI